MSADALPIELVEKVVKLASSPDDGSTAASCALVCRLWRNASRPCIFERIKITSDDRLSAFEQFVERDPAVGPLVRTLVVQPFPQLATVPSLWIARLARRLPERLSRLQTLELRCLFELGDAFENGLVSELATFTSIERLAIDQCALHFSLVFATAAAFPTLRHLQLGVIMPVPCVLRTPPAQLHPPQLISAMLDIGDVYPHGLRDASEWLLAGPTARTLRALTLVVRLGTTFEAGRLLNAVGPQLCALDLELAIAFPPLVEAEVIRADISLRPCTSLHTLTLRHHNPLSDAVCGLVAEVRAPLRRIALGVLATTHEAALPDFSPLAPLLNESLMQTLQEECILYSGPIPESVVLDKLHRDLPGITMKGSIRVEHV